jgi:hypothetical protein
VLLRPTQEDIDGRRARRTTGKLLGSRGRRRHPLHYDSQEEAIKASGELADAYQREPVVHPAAKIREKHSHRNDPSDLLG